MAERQRPVCQRCTAPGIHRTDQDCIDACKAEIDQLKQQLARRADSATRALGRWVPSFWP